MTFFLIVMNMVNAGTLTVGMVTLDVTTMTLGGVGMIVTSIGTKLGL